MPAMLYEGSSVLGNSWPELEAGTLDHVRRSVGVGDDGRSEMWRSRGATNQSAMSDCEEAFECYCLAFGGLGAHHAVRAGERGDRQQDPCYGGLVLADVDQAGQHGDCQSRGRHHDAGEHGSGDAADACHEDDRQQAERCERREPGGRERALLVAGKGPADSGYVCGRSIPAVGSIGP